MISYWSLKHLGSNDDGSDDGSGDDAGDPPEGNIDMCLWQGFPYIDNCMKNILLVHHI